MTAIPEVSITSPLITHSEGHYTFDNSKMREATTLRCSCEQKFELLGVPYRQARDLVTLALYKHIVEANAPVYELEAAN